MEHASAVIHERIRWIVWRRSGVVGWSRRRRPDLAACPASLRLARAADCGRCPCRRWPDLAACPASFRPTRAADCSRRPCRWWPDLAARPAPFRRTSTTGHRRSAFTRRARLLGPRRCAGGRRGEAPSWGGLRTGCERWSRCHGRHVPNQLVRRAGQGAAHAPAADRAAAAAAHACPENDPVQRGVIALALRAVLAAAARPRVAPVWSGAALAIAFAAGAVLARLLTHRACRRRRRRPWRCAARRHLLLARLRRRHEPRQPYFPVRLPVLPRELRRQVLAHGRRAPHRKAGTARSPVTIAPDGLSSIVARRRPVNFMSLACDSLGGSSPSLASISTDPPPDRCSRSTLSAPFCMRAP